MCHVASFTPVAGRNVIVNYNSTHVLYVGFGGTW
jgi:hypothetical protein